METENFFFHFHRRNQRFSKLWIRIIKQDDLKSKISPMIATYGALYERITRWNEIREHKPKMNMNEMPTNKGALLMFRKWTLLGTRFFLKKIAKMKSEKSKSNFFTFCQSFLKKAPYEGFFWCFCDKTWDPKVKRYPNQRCIP